MGDGRAVSDQESNSEGGGGGNRGNTKPAVVCSCVRFIDDKQKNSDLKSRMKGNSTPDLPDNPILPF